MNNIIRRIGLVIFFVFIFLLQINAQNNYLLRFAPEISQIKYGDYKGNTLGVSLSLYYTDNELVKTGHNAFTLSLKINGHGNLSYPMDGNEVIDKDKTMSFGSLSLLAGYNYFMSGWYIEPQIGYMRSVHKYKAVLFSPKLGYVYNKYDVALFLETAKGKETNAVNSKLYKAMGLSFGIIF